MLRKISEHFLFNVSLCFGNISVCTMNDIIAGFWIIPHALIYCLPL